MSPTRVVDAERVWLLMQQFVGAHSRHVDMAEALGFSLGAGRGRVLAQLADGPLTLSELAAANGFDAPYATVVVDKLERHGLVERQAHPDDRRRKLVALTAGGRGALATVDELRRRPPDAVLALTAADTRDLTRLLQRLQAADTT